MVLKEDTDTGNKYSAPSVATAIDILTFLGKYKNKNSTLTEISKGLQINNSTCYRILQTLVNQKILNYKEETKEFSLGPYLIALGSRASEFVDFMSIAKTYLKKIQDLTNSTCGIVQRIGDYWIYIEVGVPDTPYSISIRTGQRFPLNAGATAKVIMAYLSPEEREEILNRIGLKKYTDNTKFNKKEFLAELPNVKKDGFSISIGEHYEGISGVSFPILKNKEKLEFVITVIMLRNGKTEEDLKSIAIKVKYLTDELSTMI